MKANKKAALISKISLPLFLVVAILELISHLIGSSAMHQITKPLLMPLLSIYALSLLNRRGGQKLIVPVLLALFFSWLGDSFLLYQQHDAIYFIFGLCSFLLAHIVYLFLYRKISYERDSGISIKKTYLLSILFLCYGAVFIYLLWPKLGELKLPVMIYALVLMLMGVFALLRWGKTNLLSYWIVLIGAILFILSDSLIALGKFYFEEPVNGFWIMLTYILAQFLIVLGASRHHI